MTMFNDVEKLTVAGGVEVQNIPSDEVNGRKFASHVAIRHKGITITVSRYEHNHEVYVRVIEDETEQASSLTLGQSGVEHYVLDHG